MNVNCKNQMIYDLMVSQNVAYELTWLIPQTPTPEADIPMLIYPWLPHVVPHEFLTIQYGVEPDEL